MAQYTKLRNHEIQELAEQYGLEVSTYKPIEFGSANSNYILRTNLGKFILTIFEIASVFVHRMCKVLLFLEKFNFPAPRIHPSASGEMLSNYHGKLVMVKHFIEGQVITTPNDRQLKQVGHTLARMHELPVPQGISDQHRYMFEDYPLVIKKGEDQSYIRWLKDRNRHIMQNIQSDLPSGFIHGDIFWDNVLFKGQDFKAILDFEDVCHYYLAFDIGMAIIGLCTENRGIQLDKAHAFIQGYQEVRLLERREQESLQALIEYAALLTSTWRYWKYNMDLQDPQKSNKFSEMVDLANQIAKIPGAVFMENMF